MKHYIDQVNGTNGVGIAGATVDVRIANATPGSGALASIYSDDGITLKSNPVTTDSTGTFDFYVADGRYDFVVKVSGFTKIVADNEIVDATQSVNSDADWSVHNLTVTGTLTTSGGFGTISLKGATSGATILTAQPVASGTITVPSATDTLVGTATTDTLTNKTLTLPIISSISNGGTLTLPVGPDTLVGRASTDTLTNKTFNTAATGNNLQINSNTVSTVTGSGNTVVLNHNPTLDATLSFTESAVPPSVGGTDILYGDSTAHRLKLANGVGAYAPVLTDVSTDTLANKTIDTAAPNTIKINGTSLTAVTGTGAVVLATSPTITTPVIATGTGFLHATAGATDAASKLVNLTASTDVAANQGTTTTVLHGNAVGQASFAAVSLTADVTGILPTASGGTAQNSTAVFPTSGNVTTDVNTQTFTNKTYDTAGAGNVLKINGTQVSAVTGTGSVVLATGPTFPASITVGSSTALTEVLGGGVASATGFGIVYADSTAHRVKLSNNAASFDNVVLAASTDTLTNKTLDTAGAGNVLKINGTQVSAVTGSGSVVLATSPSLTTPTLGVASATSINKITITQPATGATITPLDGGVVTLPAATDTLVGKATTDTLTNKTLDTAGAGNVLKINGTQVSAVTGTGSVVLASGPTFPANVTFNAAGFFTETTAGATATGSDILYADSTAHRLKLSNNAGSFDNVVTAGSTDTLTNKTLTTPVIASISNSGTITVPTGTDTLIARTTTDTLTNKRITPRVVSMADATSVTPTSDTADVNIFTSTQVGGTLTVNAPSGTPTDGQSLKLRLKSTNAQTYSFNATYAFSTTVTAPTTLGAGKTDYIGLLWNATNTKWDVVAVDQGH